MRVIVAGLQPHGLAYREVRGYAASHPHKRRVDIFCMRSGSSLAEGSMGRGSEVHRLWAVMLAVLAAVLPVLAGEAHGWFLAGFALTVGLVAALIVPSKKPEVLSKGTFATSVQRLLLRTTADGITSLEGFEYRRSEQCLRKPERL
jgi:hypothetical protein